MSSRDHRRLSRWRSLHAGANPSPLPPAVPKRGRLKTEEGAKYSEAEEEGAGERGTAAEETGRNQAEEETERTGTEEGR